MHFIYVKEARKLSGLVIYWYLKDGTLNAVKTRYFKGHHLSVEDLRK